MGIPLDVILATAHRLFAQDQPEYDAVIDSIGALVASASERTPAELRQAVEAACLAWH